MKTTVYVETELEVDINLNAQAKVLEEAVMARFEEVKDKLLQETLSKIEDIAMRNIERRVESILGKTVVDFVQRHINEELQKQFNKNKEAT